MKALSKQEIETQLKTCAGWSGGDKGIQRTWTFPSFMNSIDFVNKIAVLAEKMDHHPDILVLYNKVKLSIFTHDAGGVTGKDFVLAREANEIAP